MKPLASERKTCRVCDAGNLRAVLDLGFMPLANALLTCSQLKKHEPAYPLQLNACTNCGHVQLSHVVPPELMFSDYPFRTGSSATMVEHFGKLMDQGVHKYVPIGGFVVEIGSNDGSALATLADREVKFLGIDPSNVFAGDVPTEKAMFDSELAQEIAEREGMADLIVACNVLGHVDDLHDFLRGVKMLLQPKGAFVIEVPDVREMLKTGAYDQIYHEHLSFFSIASLDKLLSRHGFGIFSIEHFPVHGGSIRIIAHRVTEKRYLPVPYTERNRAPILTELHEFAREVESSRQKLMAELGELRMKGLKTVGYGAAAKATVVLNYCGIGRDLIGVVVDCTPAKQGKFIPGTWQEIVAPEWLKKHKPDAIVLFAWNHREEIEQKLKAAGFHGKVLVPHGC